MGEGCSLSLAPRYLILGFHRFCALVWESLENSMSGIFGRGTKRKIRFFQNNSISTERNTLFSNNILPQKNKNAWGLGDFYMCIGMCVRV